MIAPNPTRDLPVAQPRLGYGRWKDCWPIAALAAAVRLGVLLSIPWPGGFSHPPDSDEYDRLGRNLVEQRRFSLAESPPWPDDLTRTPVYPLFVATCYAVAGPNPAVVAGAQLVLGVGGCLLAYWTGAMLFGRRAAVVAAVLLALDPLSARYAALLLSETLFTTLFLAGLLLTAVHHRRPGVKVACGIGVCLGLAILCRPIAVFWPLVVAAWMAGSARRVRSWRPVWHASLVVAIAAVFTGVWVIRNHAVGGLPVLSTVPGINLYYQRAAAVLAQREGISDTEARQRLADRLQEEVERKALGPQEEYRLMEERGWEIIGSDGPGYLRASWDGFIRMMSTQDSPPSFDDSPRLSGWVEAAYLLLLYTLAGVGSFRALFRSDWAGVVVLLLAVAYFVALSGPEAYARFRVPLMPLIALLAGGSVRRSRPA